MLKFFVPYWHAQWKLDTLLQVIDEYDLHSKRKILPQSMVTNQTYTYFFLSTICPAFFLKPSKAPINQSLKLIQRSNWNCLSDPVFRGHHGSAALRIATTISLSFRERKIGAYPDKDGNLDPFYPWGRCPVAAAELKAAILHLGTS